MMRGISVGEVPAGGQKGLGDVAGSETPEQRAAFQAKLDALAADGTLSRSHSFDSADAAAKSVLGVTAPLSSKYGLEVSGSIFAGKDGAYHYTLPQIGDPAQASLSTGWIGYHTHPSGSILFSNKFAGAGSGRDTIWVGTSGKALYVGAYRPDVGTRFAVCEPGSCSHTGMNGTMGRVLK